MPRGATLRLEVVSNYSDIMTGDLLLTANILKWCIKLFHESD
jgi:hypothetical protein